MQAQPEANYWAGTVKAERVKITEKVRKKRAQQNQPGITAASKSDVPNI